MKRLTKWFSAAVAGAALFAQTCGTLTCCFLPNEVDAFRSFAADECAADPQLDVVYGMWYDPDDQTKYGTWRYRC